MDVTLSGIVMDFKPEQLLKVASQTDVTPDGIVIEVKLEQLSKA